MRRRFLIGIRGEGGRLRLTPMKSYLRENRGKFSDDLDPDTFVSAQLRGRLLKLGWAELECEDKVVLIKPWKVAYIMARYAVYVNDAEPDITIHLEKRRSCSHLFKNIKGGQYPLDVLDDGTVKTGQTDNGYWLWIWAPDCICEPEKIRQRISNNEHVSEASKRLSVSPKICEHCG